MNAVALVVDVHRRRAGTLMLGSVVVFAALFPARLLLVDARLFVPAIALTLFGHLTLTALVWARRTTLALPALRSGSGVLVIGLVLLTLLEIVLGETVEAVLGQSALAITLGGALPSILVAPAWAVLLAGFVVARSARRAPP